MLLASPVLHAAYDVSHLDTSDRRSPGNMGRFDVRNVWLALAHAAAFAARIAREHPDVVYICTSQNAWAYLRDAVLLAIARAARCRIATHLHGSAFADFYARAIPPMRWLIRRTSRWIAAAGVMGPALRPLYHGLLPPERVHPCPPGIPDPFPHVDAKVPAPANVNAPAPAATEGTLRSHAPAPEPAPANVTDPGPANAPVNVNVNVNVNANVNVHAPVVSFLGMLYRPKGVFTLIDAARLLVAQGLDARVVFAGGWFSAADRDEILAAVAASGVADRIEFVGVVDGESKRAFLRETDIFVFPGIQPEGLPLVILEAMAAGLPVVATPVGAVADVIVDGENGVLVPPGDARALAAALARLAADAEERRRLGRAARARFLESYTDECAVGRVVALLDAALQIEEHA
jgi:glycosyltransferase involved in cell wall biosynthesis